MSLYFIHFDLSNIIFALIVGFTAGFIKGIVGFAMPMILLSGITVIVPADAALAAVILPTLFSNIQQANAQGIASALSSIKRFKVFLITGALFLLLGAFLTPLIPSKLFLGVIGCLIVSFSIFQMFGPKFQIDRSNKLATVCFAAVSGFVGGISGVWGPPTVAYLTALNTAKTEQIRVQGVIYGLGAVLLLFGHLVSGIFSWKTAPLSALLVAPAILGVWLGTRLRDRFDQKTFRTVTLLVLLIAGINLIRRAWFG